MPRRPRGGKAAASRVVAAIARASLDLG